MFKNKKVLSLSHNDLDGISCQMLLLDFVKSPSLHQCDYMGTLEQLKFIKIYMHEFDVLLVTDLILTEDIYSYLEQLSAIYPKLTIVWIDHHFQ
jgi:oligoribonuclease NrnB/cAMP/cGMP phosphodiesterase (DHH superfamily)